MLIRYILLLVILFVGSFSPILSQVVASPAVSAQKIIIKGKEYFLHVVQPSEGIYRISVNYGVSQQEIFDANDDISENLKVGQIIRIPIIKGRNSNSQELNKSRTHMYHTVTKGQTAYSIARKYNIEIESIYQNNPGTRQSLVEGAILKIPVETTNEIIRASVSAIDGYTYHEVKPKETMFAIARQYNTTVAKLVEENPALRNGVLGIGTTIRIPKPIVDINSLVKVTPDGNQRFIAGDDFLYHTIQVGQTFYSISRQYQVEINKLKSANPGVTQDDLKVGYLLRVPRPLVASEMQQNQTSNARKYNNHKVKRKETLYGISRHYHVDVETLKLLNSTEDLNNLKKGTILRIPTDAWFADRTSSALLSQQKPIIATADSAIDDFKFGDCSDNLNIGQSKEIKVALLFPFAAREASRFFSEEDTTKRAITNLPPSASRGKVFTEFYSGMLLALDTLKKQGVNVILSVYDIAPDTIALKRILNDKSLTESDIIIGPGLANELPLLSEFSRRHQIPLVYPMSNTNPELVRNPYMFHINTPDSLFYGQMSDEIVRQAAGSNLIVILPESSETGAIMFANQIKLKANQFSNGVNYIEYKSKGADLTSLQALINKDGANYVVIPSVKEAEVSKLIPIIVGVRELTKANITLFGSSDWLRFQTIDPEDIHQLNGSIFSPFAIDYKQPTTQRFIKKYRQWYHTEAHAISPYFQTSSASSNFSRYGIWGYDVTYFFVTAINKYGSNFDMCLSNFQHHEIQFNFDFKRISNWGGFYNHGLYIIKFNSNLSTERIPVRTR